MEHKGSSGFHSLLGQTESFNYPQRVCTVAYGVGYSLYYILLILVIHIDSILDWEVRSFEGACKWHTGNTYR